jgi:hypothetical protein
MATAAEIDDALTRTFHPALIEVGFERVDRRRWVRSTRLPIRDVFEMGSLKSGTLTPIWGVSLDFVPHVSGGRDVRWHRTAKTARFDLRFDPVDSIERNTPEAEAWSVFPPFEPVAVVTKDLTSLARLAIPEALRFWSPLTTVADLPEAIRQKKERPTVRFGFENYVQEPLAEAFVFAALGDARAVGLLDAYVSGYEVSPQAAAQLRSRLGDLLASRPAPP